MTDVAPSMREIADAWLEQAKHDLDTARLLAGNARCDWAAYASSQAAEKAVKAMLIAWGADFNATQHAKAWKIHKLSDLFHAFRRLPKNATLATALTVLSNHDQNARYPELATPPCRSYTENQVSELIQQGAAVVAYATHLVPAIERATDDLEVAAEQALATIGSPDSTPE